MSQYGGKVYVVHKCDRSCQGNRLSSVQYWGLNWGLQHERQFVFCSGRISLWKAKTVIRTTMGKILFFLTTTRKLSMTHTLNDKLVHKSCIYNVQRTCD